MSDEPDEHPHRLRISWDPATPGDLAAAIAAVEADRPDDWPERLSAALAALRGWSVIRGVSVYRGEVWIADRDLHMSGDARIENCQVRTPRPVVVAVNSTGQFTGCEGDAIQAVVRQPG